MEDFHRYSHFDVFVVTPLAFKIGLVKTFWTLVMVVIISKSLDWFLQALKRIIINKNTRET